MIPIGALIDIGGKILDKVFPDPAQAEQAKLNRLLADGSLYVSDPKKAADMAVRITQIDDEMLTAMERWETLGQRVPV